jgi:Flp pilus assembly protein TadD
MTSIVTPYRLLPLVSLLLFSTALVGCASAPSTPDASGKIVTEKPDVKPADNADILYGETRDNLNTIEAQYQNKKDNKMIAARYGKALREAGKMKEAKEVLLPLSDDKAVGTLVSSELSTIYFAEGNFSKAESFARKSIKKDNANYRAWRNLGNALDAQEKYVEGETAFKKSLDLWTGKDKVPVMNNLALNLAAQGYTDRALTLLYEAQKMSPDRIEIERNIRIIRTLSEPPEFNKPKRPLPESKAPE